jgi:hypothetical protein
MSSHRSRPHVRAERTASGLLLSAALLGSLGLVSALSPTVAEVPESLARAFYESESAPRAPGDGERVSRSGRADGFADPVGTAGGAAVSTTTGPTTATVPTPGVPTDTPSPSPRAVAATDAAGGAGATSPRASATPQDSDRASAAHVLGDAKSAYVAHGARLTWAPPELKSPRTIHLSPTQKSVKLDSEQDYILELPDTPLTAVGGITVEGGDDVVMIGGEISTVAKSDGAARGLYLKDQTGTVHIEGLRLSGAHPTEGINLNQHRGATVQLQNILVETVHGSYSGHHADVLQTWAGPARLRVDRLEGWTTYQGFFLAPFQFGTVTPESFDLRNVVLRDVGNRSAYLLWQTGDFPIETHGVTVVHNSTNPFPRQVLHAPGSAWSGVAAGGAGSASPLSGKPGTAYVSPGYANG